MKVSEHRLVTPYFELQGVGLKKFLELVRLTRNLADSVVNRLKKTVLILRKHTAWTSMSGQDHIVTNFDRYVKQGPLGL